MKYTLGTIGVIVAIGGIAWGGQNTMSYNAMANDEHANITVVPQSAQQASVYFGTTESAEPKQTTLLFGGDVMLSRGINDVMRKRNDFFYPFRQINDFTAEADITVVNLESPISSQGENKGSIYSFRADPRAIVGLIFAGIDVVTFANNHTGDYGTEAISETLELLRWAEIDTVGVGVDMNDARKARFLEVNDLKIAFLGATPLSPAWLTRWDSAPAVAPFDEQLMIENIATARRDGADIVAVLLHWGNEYETKHLPSQEEIAHRLVDAGATLIIGHHPHVVQEVERYNGGVIAYSLGNFVFDQNFSADTNHGLLLKIVLGGKDIASVEEIPIQFSSSYQPFVKKDTTK